MDPAMYMCIFLPLFIILISADRSQKLAVMRIKLKKKKGRSQTEMGELIKRYIGKECLIYTANSQNSQIIGVIDALENGWISVKTKTGSDIINIDYISHIREYPKNKKGKNAALVLD